MEDGSNLHRELLFASTALESLLIAKPDQVIDLAATNAELMTIRPTHLRDFINADLLIAKVFDCFYEGGRIGSNLHNYGWFVKYVIANRVDVFVPPKPLLLDI